MPTLTAALTNPLDSFAGGTDAIQGYGAITWITFGGAWLTAEEFSLIFTDGLSGLQTLIGAGNVTEFVPSYVSTYNNKIYALGGPTVFFCALNLPTTWNDPNASGNGYVTMNNWWNTPDYFIAMQPFQGYLAFFSRWNIQIWQTDANPANWQIIQQLPNAGSFAPLSVVALGELDVLFLSYTGLRSLRVRDYSLTGFINDIGSPIDAFVLKNLIGGSPQSNSEACSIVDPTTGRYWCYLNGVIYVLSYYPSNKIVAWSTYSPTDSNGNVMTVEQFVVFQGQVWAYGTDSNGNTAAWAYGGDNNETYDASVVTIQTPFYDSKAPSVNKQSEGFDFVLNSEFPPLVDGNNPNYATWTCSFNMDPQNTAAPVFTTVYTGSVPTYDLDAIAASDSGTHVQVRLVSSGTGPATLNGMTWPYKLEAVTTG
jgi:hypothetical protein